MTNFKELRIHCRNMQQLTSTVIDDFLILYAARRDKLYNKAEKKLVRYRHISRDLPDSWSDMVITQFIAHRIFKHNGLINRYIHQSGLHHLLDEEMAFLEKQAGYPWRFSFAEISGSPERDFYEMKDVFTGESYLLFSPALTTIMSSQNVRLCFNLVGFNGECWQTYGPINAYRGFEPSDILFYATELNRGDLIENGQELMELVETNPMPFMLLFYGSLFPPSFHIDDQILEIISEYLDDSFDTDAFRDRFTVEYSHGVYKLSLPDWNQFPHFAAVYYDEDEELLLLHSMTDRGFSYLIRQLNACGYELDAVPDIRVNMGMLQTAGDILKKDFNLNPYSSMFSTESPEEDPEELKNINKMLSAMLPYLNAGQKVDLNEMSNRYSVSLETVREIHEQLLSKLDQMR